MHFTTKVYIGESFYSRVNVFWNKPSNFCSHLQTFFLKTKIWSGKVPLSSSKGFQLHAWWNYYLNPRRPFCSDIFDCKFDVALRVQLWFLFPVLKLSNSTFFKRRKKLIWMGVSNSFLTEWFFSCQWHAMIYLGTFSLNSFLLILQ